MALVVVLVLAIPFAVSGRWGLLGVGFNNDLGLHLAWAEWLRSGFGPAPDAGYPLGPHGLAVATAAVPGIGLGQAFLGEIIAIGVLTGLTALGALRRPRRRCAGRWPRRWSPSPTSPPPTSPRPPSRRPPRRSSCSPSPSTYCDAGRARRRALVARLRSCCCPAGARRRHLLLLQLRRARLADRDRRPLEPDPASGAAGAAAAGAAALPAAADDAADRWSSSPAWRCWRPWSGPSASPAASTKSPAATPTAPSPRSRRWGSGRPRNYRLDAAGGAQLPGLAGAIAILALLVGVAWWVAPRRADDPGRARRLRPPLPRLAPLQRRLLPGQGADDRRAAGDARRDPAAAERVRRAAALLRHRLVAAGGGLHRRRDLLELPGAARRAGRAGRATASSCGPSCRSSMASRCSTRARTATRPTGCWGPTPTCRWSSSPTPTSRPTRRSRSTPATPTARSTSTPSRAGRSNASTTWSPAAPPGTASRRRTSSGSPRPPPTCSGNGPGRPPRTAMSCSRGPRPGRSPAAPRRRSASLLDQPRPRLAVPRSRDRPESRLGRGQRPRHRRRDLAGAGAPGRGLEPLAPVLLALRPDPDRPRLPRAAGGSARRPAPEHDQPRQQRPVLAGRALRERRRPTRFTLAAAEASSLQRLSGYDGKAYVGELVAVPDRAPPQRRP